MGERVSELLEGVVIVCSKQRHDLVAVAHLPERGRQAARVSLTIYEAEEACINLSREGVRKLHAYLGLWLEEVSDG